MKKRILLLIALAFLAGLACGCAVPAGPGFGSPPAPLVTPSMVAPLSIHINATPSRYNPAMSSTIGIRLTPVNTSGILPSDARFTWETNFGTFYHWGPPDFKVVELAPKYTGTADPVYWSYFSEHGEKYRRPVNIALTVEEDSTGKIIANATLGIGWEDPQRFTAIVVGEE